MQSAVIPFSFVMNDLRTVSFDLFSSFGIIATVFSLMEGLFLSLCEFKLILVLEPSKVVCPTPSWKLTRDTYDSTLTYFEKWRSMTCAGCG